MAKNNQDVTIFFNGMDNSKAKTRELLKKIYECSIATAQNKENIYNVIYNVLPRSAEKAITAREVTNKVTGDPYIAKRVTGMLTGKAQSDSFFSSSYDHIMKHKKTFCTYSIECDENGNPIPNAIPIKRKQERNVYWYK